MSSAIAVIGAGSWGTALAIQLARRGSEVRLWGHEPDVIEQLDRERKNQLYLPDITFPEALRPVRDLASAIENVEEILIAVPSHAFATVIQHIRSIQPEVRSLCWATKGLDPKSSQLLHQVAHDYLPNTALAVVSGPTFAIEVAQGLPTALTVASPDLDHAQRVAGYLHRENFRAYTSNDIIGVQVGGAAKNVMAIAAGISDGLNFGANARAALITRGLVEITRLGVALGAHRETFMGLAGLGDLALTCTDDKSRNRRMGLALAKGIDIDQAKQLIGQEVEGVATTKEIYLKSQQLKIDMPITEQIYRLLYEGIGPETAVKALLDRGQKAEENI